VVTATAEEQVQIIGRYALHGELASGGMAAVHLGRLLGPVGFSRTVAIKRLHSHHARDPEFVNMFLDEGRIVARIKHPNVVPTLDIVALDGELFLVMEYVHGAPISKIMGALSRRKERMPVNIAVGICVGFLEGLHAAHEAKNEDGAPLHIVHRDISPQNVIVGADGIPRVLDFGIAKAAERLQVTEDGSFKGKLGYMPPDVLSGGVVDRRADLWGAAVVLWEMLVGKRLFSAGESPHALVRMIVERETEAPSARGVATSPALDAVILRALAKDPGQRYATAREMASALEDATPVASARVIGDWLAMIVGDQLEERAALVEQVERMSRALPPSPATLKNLVDSGPELAPGSNGTPSYTPPPNSSIRATSAEVPTFAIRGSSPSSGMAPPARTKHVVVAGMLAAFLLVGGLVAALVWLRSNPRAPWATTTSPLPSLSTTADAPPQPSAPESTSAPLPPPTAPTEPPASASSAPPAKAPPKGRPTRPSSPPKSCNPPYTIGPPPDYIRRPKLECLPQ
jgi:serine/threonine protein kinase